MDPKLVAFLLAAVGAPVAILLVLFVIGFQNPDKAQRWGEMIWSVISRFHAGGKRKVVQYGVQSRLTSFAADLARETGRPRATPVSITWAEPNEAPAHFFADNRVVIRLHSAERQDRNLMTASMFYVSDTLVRRAKRYLSKKQGRSIDLYAVDRLLTRTAPGAADLFAEEVMGPECDTDHELRDLVVDYQLVDKRIKAFFPIYVRELNYLAQKVVVKPAGGQLIADAKELHRFLVRYSNRKVGDHIPMEVQGRFLRCAVMIVAQSVKREIGNREPYLRYLGDLSKAGHETIYLVGSASTENRAFMDAIARDFLDRSGWSEVDRRTYDAVIKNYDDTDMRVRNLLIVLRSNEPRDYVGEADAVDAPEGVLSLAEIDAEG